MAFEQSLRDRINSYPFSAPERSVLKVVLGEWQQKAASGKVTDEMGHTIVKKMIKANEENLGYLQEGDARRAQYLAENEVLGELLPAYLTADQIKQSLEAAGTDLRSPGEGQALGRAMGHFKLLGLPVEGQTVKDVVLELRKN